MIWGSKAIRTGVIAAGATGLAFAAGSAASAAVIDTETNQIVSEGGEIFVEFNFLEAAHSSNLVAPGAGPETIFNNQSAAIGALFDVGTFAAGEVVEFRLDNLTTEISYFTGLASDNIDNVLHAMLTANADGSITVGFEDLRGGGDFDYDDLVFTVYEMTVPIPGAALLLLTGLAGLGFANRGGRREMV